jgi:hypothetical protein
MSTIYLDFASDLSKMMQIICNFGFWKIRLFKNIIQQFFFLFTKWLNNSKWRRPLKYPLLDHNFCIFQPIFKIKHVLEAQLSTNHKLFIFTIDDFFFFKMTGIFKMAFFRFLMLFFKLWCT